MNPSTSLGLIKLPHLAGFCQQIGLSPITGADYRDAATAIRDGMEAGGPFPILVSDEQWPGLRAWTEKSARETRVVVLRVENGVGHPFNGIAADITLPATVGEIMAAAGLAIAPQAAHLVVDATGVVTQPGAPVAQQVAPAPPAAPSVPQAQQPVFEQPAAPVYEPPVFEAPAAAPVQDPWEAQEQPAFEAPAAPTYEAPTFEQPTFEQPTFVQPAAPVYTEPVFEQPAAPVYEAPVFEAPAAAPVQDPWEAQEQIQPAQAAYEQPAFEAPAAPTVPAAPAFPVHDPAQAPVFEQPVFEQPAAPVYEAPVYTEPTYTEPTYTEPTYAQPTAPVFEAPAAPAFPVHDPAQAPVFEQPVYEQPTAPVFEAPAAPAFPVHDPAQAPVFEQPVYEQPFYEQPTYEQPTYEQPVFEQPVAPGFTQPVVEEVAPQQIIGITPQPRQSGLAEVMVVWAGKGGVGKSTCSFSLAQRAAKAGLRVILIDANFGQGDMRTFLRIGNAGLPSIYQAALSRDLKQALIDPDTLNATRSPKLDPLGFAVVQAPPAHLTDAKVVTPEAYMLVVEQAREICDLVVIDTQIIESLDTSGMVDRFVTPLLRAGAWGIGITDLSSPGISNLLTRLKAFAAQGVPRANHMTAMNRIPRGVQFNIEGVSSTFNEHSAFLGAIYADDAIPENMNRGRAVSNMPVIAPILDAALNTATGRAEFSPNAAAAAAAQAELTEETAKSGGLFGRFRKGKN